MELSAYLNVLGVVQEVVIKPLVIVMHVNVDTGGKHVRKNARPAVIMVVIKTRATVIVTLDIGETHVELRVQVTV